MKHPGFSNTIPSSSIGYDWLRYCSIDCQEHIMIVSIDCSIDYDDHISSTSYTIWLFNMAMENHHF